MDSDREGARASLPLRPVLLVLFALAAFLIWYFARDWTEVLTEREESLRAWTGAHFGTALVASFLIYTTMTGLSLPGATLLTLVLGWLLGTWWALPVVSFASTAGAAITFLLSRFLFRDWLLDRYGDRLSTFNEALEREGAFYLFSLRLIPAVPYFAINLVMGLTPLRLRTFWWVSQLGMLPGTFVYVKAGAALPRLSELREQGLSGILTPDLFLSFLLLGLFPLLARWLSGALRRRTPA